jgi:hypothetical protein
VETLTGIKFITWTCAVFVKKFVALNSLQLTPKTVRLGPVF